MKIGKCATISSTSKFKQYKFYIIRFTNDADKSRYSGKKAKVVEMHRDFEIELNLIDIFSYKL